MIQYYPHICLWILIHILIITQVCIVMVLMQKLFKSFVSKKILKVGSVEKIILKNKLFKCFHKNISFEFYSVCGLLYGFINKI